ncbi:MAG: hypothetical protein M1833_005685, partial [Piccolia ochrophora]
MPPIRTQPHNQRPHSAAHPTRKIFDPWNSSATGHQRAENRLSGSTSWRDSRHTKLAAQFAGGHGGGRRLADTVGAGCEHFGTDGRKENGDWEKGAPGLREKGWQSVGEMMRRGGTPTTREKDILGGEDCGKRTSMLSKEKTEEDRTTPPASPTERKRKLFSSLTFYINGSTLPLVSDHRLKHLIAQHGGRVAIGLARRSVTHVVLGTPNGRHNAGGAAGAGGGLAAGKIEKE